MLALLGGCQIQFVMALTMISCLILFSENFKAEPRGVDVDHVKPLTLFYSFLAFHIVVGVIMIRREIEKELNRFLLWNNIITVALIGEFVLLVCAL